MPADMKQALDPVLRLLDRAISLSDDPNASAAYAPEVSGWTVLQHLEHLLLADTGIIAWLCRAADGKADPDVAGGITLLGRVLLLTGRIPRGRGKAPSVSVPAGRDRSEVAQGLREQRALAAGLGKDPGLIHDRSSKLRHPYFGALIPGQWVRFLEVHHAHHSRIMADILRHGS